jgi:hypothetical protein
MARKRKLEPKPGDRVTVRYDPGAQAPGLLAGRHIEPSHTRTVTFAQWAKVADNAHYAVVATEAAAAAGEEGED